MKILINNFKRLVMSILMRKIFYTPLIMISLAIIFSASSMVEKDDLQSKDSHKNWKLDLLEKLESGKQVSPEDFQLLFKDNSDNDILSQDPDLPSVPDILCFPAEHSFPGPFFYHDYDETEFGINPDICIRINHEKLLKNIDQLRKEVESFRNSEEFLNLQEDLRKWGDQFRKDIEKMKEDIIRSGRELRHKHND